MKRATKKVPTKRGAVRKQAKPDSSETKSGFPVTFHMRAGVEKETLNPVRTRSGAELRFHVRELPEERD
jgi:hypothetical protein